MGLGRSLTPSMVGWARKPKGLPACLSGPVTSSRSTTLDDGEGSLRYSQTMTTSRYSRRPRHFSRTPNPAFPQLRHVTVGSIWCRGKSTPWIRLKGQWLKQAGFTSQSLVAVVVMPGRLELTLVRPTQTD